MPPVYGPVDDSYFNYNSYRKPDYSKEKSRSGEKLPGPDFNKQVYDFDERKHIWDQNDYEERVKVEAELMVALEALKSSVNYLTIDIGKLDQIIAHQYKKISSNQ